MSAKRGTRGGPGAAGKPNWSNQTIWTGDNLPVMRGMNSESVDLIYLDPPFNSNHDYAAPIGSKAAGAAFKDTWGLNDISLAWHGEIRHEHPDLYTLLNAARKIHGDSTTAYLMYMVPRIMEMNRLLKPTGSVYLHCDPTMSHYLKLVMDAVFGRDMFQNEVVWCYREAINARKRWNRKHDILLFYSKSGSWTFNADQVLEPHSESTIRKYRRRDAKGRYRLMGRGIAGSPIRSKRDVSPKWEETNPELVYRQYLRAGTYAVDYWNIDAINQNAKERTGYPTQKPLPLLRRIIKASSNEGDVVLDPFCGCATACIAAEGLGRRWTGIDKSPKTAELVKSRMRDEVGVFFEGAHRADIPERTDQGRLPPPNNPANKRILHEEQGGYCNGCQTYFEPRHLEVDHIIARKMGGTDHISNLQLLCGSCNRTKGAKSHEYLIACLTDKGWIKRKKEEG